MDSSERSPIFGDYERLAQISCQFKQAMVQGIRKSAVAERAGFGAVTDRDRSMNQG